MRDKLRRHGVRRYHTGPGFFINTHLIFVTVSASVWVYLLLALTDSQTYPCGTVKAPETCSVLTGEQPWPGQIQNRRLA